MGSPVDWTQLGKSSGILRMDQKKLSKLIHTHMYINTKNKQIIQELWFKSQNEKRKGMQQKKNLK